MVVREGFPATSMLFGISPLRLMDAPRWVVGPIRFFASFTADGIVNVPDRESSMGGLGKQFIPNRLGNIEVAINGRPPATAMELLIKDPLLRVVAA